MRLTMLSTILAQVLCLGLVSGRLSSATTLPPFSANMNPIHHQPKQPDSTPSPSPQKTSKSPRAQTTKSHGTLTPATPARRCTLACCRARPAPRSNSVPTLQVCSLCVCVCVCVLTLTYSLFTDWRYSWCGECGWFVHVERGQGPGRCSCDVWASAGLDG